MTTYATVMKYEYGIPEYGPDILAKTDADAWICARKIGAVDILKLIESGIAFVGLEN